MAGLQFLSYGLLSTASNYSLLQIFQMKNCNFHCWFQLNIFEKYSQV